MRDGTGFYHARNYILCVVVVIFLNLIIITEKADDKTDSTHVTLRRVRVMLVPPVIQKTLYHCSARGRFYGTFMSPATIKHI